MKKLIIIVFVLSFYFHISAQNELYIESTAIFYIDGEATANLNNPDATTPTVFVDGEVINVGTLTNDEGEIQIKGNLTQNGTYASNGDDVFNGTTNQTISGTLNDGTNHLHHLIIDKTTQTDLILSNNVRADNSIKFVTGGVVVTGSNYIYLNNNDATTLTGYSTIGTTDKFIQGNLRRAVRSDGASKVYHFPVGYSHTAAAGAEGNQIAVMTINGVNTVADGTGIISASFARDLGEEDGLSLLDCSDLVPVIHRIDHGQWTLENVDTDDDVDAYDLTLQGANEINTFGAADFTIVKSNDGTTWGFDGSSDSCDGVATTVANVSRTGFTAFSLFQIGGTGTIVLPVELLSFKAQNFENQWINLDWITETEDNAAGFEIQRATEDNSNFERIAWVNANGNTLEQQVYHYEDKNVVPNVDYLYRLKMIDLDNSFEYSDIKNASINKEKSLLIYPNPAFETINVQLNETVVNGEIKILDLLGRIVFQEELNNKNICTISTKDWKAGNYIIQYVDDNYYSRFFKISVLK